MINKSLKKIFKNIQILKYFKNINMQLRPSDLSPEKYYEITKVFEDLN